MLFKDDEISWLDKSCLQIMVKRKEKTETLTFQVICLNVLQCQFDFECVFLDQYVSSGFRFIWD